MLRTYTRKPPQYRLIEGVEELCRLCLGKPTKALPIFCDSIGTPSDVLPRRIMMCVGLEVTNEDCLPHLMCSNCFQELQRCYAFRKTCEISYRKLKLHLLAFKEKQYKVKRGQNKEVEVQTDKNVMIEKTSCKDVPGDKQDVVIMVDADGTVRLCDETGAFTVLDMAEQNAQSCKNKFGNDHNTIPLDENKERKPENNICTPLQSNITVTESTKLGNSSDIVVPSDKTVTDETDTRSKTRTVAIGPVKEIDEIEIQPKPKEQAPTNQHELHEPPTANLSATLSSVLIELGILAHRDGGLVVVDAGRSTLELETADGEYVTLELMEEDDTLELPDKNGRPTQNRISSKITAAPTQQKEQPPSLDVSVIDIDEGRVVYAEARANSDKSGANSNKSGENSDKSGANSNKSGENSDKSGANSNKSGENSDKSGANGDKSSANSSKSGANDKKHEWRDRRFKQALGTWCASCGKQLASRTALARHQRDVHERARPFACRVCGRSFAQRGVMLRHELVHAESRPHKCSVCPKSFTQRGALAAHERSHAPPHARPILIHRCTRCPKLFLYASGLSRHMLTHTGIVFVCGSCQRPFNDKSSLKRHLKATGHLEESEDVALMRCS